VHGKICVAQRLYNGNNFATSAALVEVCTLLSVILLVISLTLSALFVSVFLVSMNVDLFDDVVTLTSNLSLACGDMAVLLINNV